MEAIVQWIFHYGVFLIVAVGLFASTPAHPLRISPPLVDRYASLGSKLWWTCSAVDAVPPSGLSILWRFNGVNLVSDSRRTLNSNGTMYIPVVQTDHLGEYTCAAADSLAAVEAKAWLRLAYISQSAVIQPMVQSVKWGGLVMLECRVDAQPSASFSWTIDGVDAKLSAGLTITQLSTGVSTLRITDVRYENAGSYACSVSHVTLASPLRSTSATVTVYGAPQLGTIADLQDFTLPIGYTCTFKCPALSEPASQIFWSFQAQSSPSALPLSSAQLGVSIDTVTGTLVLDSVSEASSGEYRCTWRNQYGEISKTFRLAVQGMPSSPQFTMVPSDVVVIEKNEAIMNCSGTGNPSPTIEWLAQKGGEEIVIANSKKDSLDSALEISADVISFSLAIKNISKTDFGMYTCRLMNEEGQVNISAYLEVLFAPFFIAQPQATTIREGEELKLVCTVSGNPQPSISWTSPTNTTYTYDPDSNSDSLSSEKNVVVLENGLLNIKKVTREHNGVFTCSAQNTVGSTSVSVTVSISGAPHLIKRPKSLGAIEGDRVSLTCEVSASPPATVVWYYRYLTDLSVQATNMASLLASITTPNGDLSISNVSVVDVQNLPRYSLGPDGSSIVIENLQKNDAGFYVCHAQNVHGAAFALAALRVISFPQFQIVPESSKVSIGDSINLNCYSIGVPVPTQRWLFQGRKLDTKPGLQELSNGSLFIKSVTEEDLGTYTCLATNQAGQRSATAVLSITNKPLFLESPNNVTVELTSSTTLRCRGESSLPLQVFWYESNASGELVQLLLNGSVGEQSIETQLSASDPVRHVGLNSNGDLEIHCVNKHSVGWYLCQLRNEEGVAISDPAYVDVLYIPNSLYLNVSPNNPTELQNVTLSCKAEGIPLPLLSWITPSKTEMTATEVTMAGVSIQPSIIDSNRALTSVLEIGRVHSEAHGGAWVCKACNVKGCRGTTSELSIQGKPAIKSVYYENGGVGLSLACSSTGSPPAEVKYYYGDNQTPVVGLDGHRIENNILYVQQEDLMSNYFCNAENILGISATIALAPPSSGTIIEAEPEDKGARFVFSARRDIVSLAPTLFVLEWRKVGEPPESGWSSNSLHLDQTVDGYMESLKNINYNDTILTCADSDADGAPRQTRSTGDLVAVSESSTVTVDSAGSKFSYTIRMTLNSLEANTEYEVQARLLNVLGSGSPSPLNRVRTPSSAPDKVTNIQIDVENLNVTVTWNHPEPLNGQPQNVIVRVELYNASEAPPDPLLSSEIKASEESRTQFTVPDLGTYSLQITASNLLNGETGETATTVFSVQKSVPSFVPDIVQILVMASFSLQVHWTTPQKLDGLDPIIAPVTGFRLLVETVSGHTDPNSNAIQEIDIFNGSVSFLTIDDLLEHETYSFRVAAMNSAGRGAYSEPATASTLYRPFSQKALDGEIPDIGIRWRLLAIILIVCFSVMIVVIGIVLFSVQAKLSKCKSVDLTPPQSSRGRSIEEDWEEVTEETRNEEKKVPNTNYKPSGDKAQRTEQRRARNGGRTNRSTNRADRANESDSQNGAANSVLEGYPNDSFIMY